MNYITHTIVMLVWLLGSRYSVTNLEAYGYDPLLAAMLFICGVCACSQAFILLTEAEEIVCK